MGRIIGRPAKLILLGWCCFGMLVFADTGKTHHAPPADPFAVTLEQRLTHGPVPATRVPLDMVRLRRFYQSRLYHPVWYGKGESHVLAERWVSVLDHIENEGLNDHLLHGKEIRRQMAGRTSMDPVDQELVLTDSFFRYTNILSQGQLDPLQFSAGWYIPTKKVKPAVLLKQARLDGGFDTVFQSLRGEEYVRLSNLLEEYLRIRDSGGWPSLDVVGVKLQAGVRHRDIATLDRLLRTTGDLRGKREQAEHRFDATLETAVRRFQRRHGLRADGIVGKRTRAQLAIPVEVRIDQIRANLERLRWLPEDLGNRYILVNSAAFVLEVHEAGYVPLRMKVVVGRKKRQTPVFTSQLSHLVVNPYWNIPRKLALEDVIPQQLEDPDYFHHNGIRVLSGWQSDAEELDPEQIDWQSYLDGEFLSYRLRQDPGKYNSLGRIKFMLPNRFSIYLHDTPAAHLFDKPVRTYSSGCIRLEKPLALASWLLRDHAEPVTVEELLEHGETLQLDLPETVPVYLLYKTAWVDDKGRGQFRPDVYGRDAPIVEALPHSVPTAGQVRFANNQSADDDVNL